jgi:hypothetical protein
VNFKPWPFILLLLAFSACRRNASELPPTIVVSGDTAGWIVPCGCTSNQSGGLPRRGAFVEECRRQGPVIVADVGGTPRGVSTYDKLKFEAVLRGELVMGIAAHNIGRAEAELGPDYLRRVQQELKVPMISANAADAEGNPLAEPMRIVEAGGRRVMFVGVLDPKYQTEKVRIAPPRQAIWKVLQRAAGKFDQVVVLAYMPEDNLRELTENMPEVDVVVGGPTGQPVQPVNPYGYVLLTSATRQGKFMAKLTCSPTGEKNAKLRGEIVELDGRFADDSKQAENVRQFYAELKRRDLSPKDTSFVDDLPMPVSSRSAATIAGSDACKACHDEDHHSWKKSKHAEAWKSLVEKDAQYNPDCQRCHVTGYGEPGGFETVRNSPKRVGVGCESCHGISSAHCQKTSTRTQWAEQAKEQCLRCHDRENSPKFDYETYWAKIQHGKTAVPPEETITNDK